ncbi:MAG: 50S ribosomal protein L3 [Candidatus Shikimatogenerans bostrichidophilus]|nr:MAG: 50S ribosomal protein L3 [Candidatus Shikimatogenerans bostrichidophilus]
MIGIIGNKLRMINLFKENILYPCTIIYSNPNKILEIKKNNNNNYSLILGYNIIKKVNKPLMGYFLKIKKKFYKKIIEFNKIKKKYILKYINKKYINLNIFKIGEKVDISGISIGKGFQGVVKRYNFSGVGDKTHGQHNRLRTSGSIGAGTYPSKVIKGMKMSGRMGNKKVTIKNLKILDIDLKNNFLIIKGSVPGNNKNFLIIKKKYENKK